ncbi:hypothetical protein MEQU1_002637 [Malassezia equina]|uniref:Vacuolar protein sorting-associated protein 54 n=1 Tax=Malassezia equina TaxID=1381935 RepID=A0AAF0EKS7_9BASI|nr:hypothetical protein MEQU1_002637 [Malassezia equina]
MSGEQPDARASATEGAHVPEPAGQDSSFSLAGMHTISAMLNHPWRKPPPIHAGSSKFPDVGPAGHVATAPPAADISVLERYVAQHGAEWDKLDRERAMARTRQAPTDPGTSRLPPLSTVPQVFFSSDFDLGNPYTFDLVTERYKQTTALGAEADPDTLQYGVVLNQMLQEKLSYYLDVIEQHLVAEIGAKSASFFDALSTLQQLRTDAQDCLAHMDGVSTQLDAIESHVQDGLDLAQVQAERRALEAQHDVLRKVQRLLDRRHLVTLSVQHGEYDNAMTTMEEIRQALRTDPEFQGVASLQALLPQLDEEQANMARELQSVLTELMDTMVLPRKEIHAIDLSVCVPPFPLDQVLPSQVPWLAEPRAQAWEPVWDLLQRCDGLDAALDAYAERVGPLVLNGVSERLAAYAPAEWAVPSATTEQLTAPAWEVYVPGLAALLHVLWRITQHIQRIQAAWAERASQAQVQRLTQATRSLWAAVERHIVHVMTPRRAQLTTMAWDAFVVYHSLVWRFVHLAESSAGRPGVALRSCVLTQAKAYLGAQHRQRIERAVRAVEDEVWAPAPVSPDSQATVQRLQEAAQEDVALYRVERALGGTSPAIPATEGEATRQLTLGDKPFFVVKAAGTVLGLLDDYVRLVINLPLFAAEVLGWIVELLKQFNSRTCQVVLGAGAMRSAGLKNITARHLALAAQTLSLMMALLPSLRALMKRHLTASQAVLLGDFDKLQRDFREHQYEIHAKLVAIMGDRVHVHCKAMTNVDVSAGAGPSAPIADLVRETGTLYRVMSQYLEPSVVDASVAQVARDIDTRMAVAVSAVDVRSTEAHTRLLNDLAFLDEKMKSMYPPWKGEQLHQAVKGKTPKPQLEPRRPTTEPLGYKPRRSLGKRPPSTQSPQLESMEAFQQPVPPVPAKDVEASAPSAPVTETAQSEPAKGEPPAKAEPPAKVEPDQQETPEALAPQLNAPEAPTVDHEAQAVPAPQASSDTPAETAAAQAQPEKRVAGPPLEIPAATTPTSRLDTQAATESPASSPVSPTKEGRRPRISLEQRLAEAAKRRGMQRQTPMPTPGPPSPEKPTMRKLSLAERLAGAAKAEGRSPESSRAETQEHNEPTPALPPRDDVSAESSASEPKDAATKAPMESESEQVNAVPDNATTVPTEGREADTMPPNAATVPEKVDAVPTETARKPVEAQPSVESVPSETNAADAQAGKAEAAPEDEAPAPVSDEPSQDATAPGTSGAEALGQYMGDSDKAAPAPETTLNEPASTSAPANEALHTKEAQEDRTSADGATGATEEEKATAPTADATNESK